jgi:DNA-binding CsgD family transcriptional regulator
VGGRFSDLGHHIDCVYQAAVAPEHWPVFLDALSKELWAASIHILFRCPSDRVRGIDFSLGVDVPTAEAYHTYFYKISPWLPDIAAASEGQIRAFDSFVPDAELLRTEFYNDWMRPQGILHGLGGSLCKSDSQELVSSFGAFREKGRGAFEKQDLDRILLLVPHLQRALTIQRRVGAAELRAGATEEALDQISGGVILLDERGAPIVTNRSADRILAMNDGLTLDRDGPRAALAEQTRELQRALAGAAMTGASKGEDAGAVLRLARPSGRPALEVVVTPIRQATSPLFDRRATAAIFVAESDAQAERPPERLRRIYGLTPMEAEVASRIASGMGLGEISDALGISIHTVRGHLKQLFRKTGAHRQAELVRVLLTGLADLRLD